MPAEPSTPMSRDALGGQRQRAGSGAASDVQHRPAVRERLPRALVRRRGRARRVGPAGEQLHGTAPGRLGGGVEDLLRDRPRLQVGPPPRGGGALVAHAGQRTPRSGCHRNVDDSSHPGNRFAYYPDKGGRGSALPQSRAARWLGVRGMETAALLVVLAAVGGVIVVRTVFQDERRGPPCRRVATRSKPPSRPRARPLPVPSRATRGRAARAGRAGCSPRRRSRTRSRSTARRSCGPRSSAGRSRSAACCW